MFGSAIKRGEKASGWPIEKRREAKDRKKEKGEDLRANQEEEEKKKRRQSWLSWTRRVFEKKRLIISWAGKVWLREETKKI